MKSSRGSNKGVVAAAFGVGLVVSFMLPAKTVAIILSVAVVCLGISCTRC